MDNEIANLEKAIAGLGGMVSQDKLQAMKAQLAAKKQQRSNLKTQVANIIDHQIKVLKDTDLANLIKEVDGYILCNSEFDTKHLSKEDSSHGIISSITIHIDSGTERKCKRSSFFRNMQFFNSCFHIKR